LYYNYIAPRKCRFYFILFSKDVFAEKTDKEFRKIAERNERIPLFFNTTSPFVLSFLLSLCEVKEEPTMYVLGERDGMEKEKENEREICKAASLE
jgi:hypothetical protein